MLRIALPKGALKADEPPQQGIVLAVRGISVHGLKEPIKTDFSIEFRPRHGWQDEADPLQAWRSDLHEQSSDCFFTSAPIFQADLGELFARQVFERNRSWRRAYHGR